MNKKTLKEEKYEHITHPFPPLYDSDSKLLILGSLPSVKSREQMFFYGHPQNRFWRVISAVLLRHIIIYNTYFLINTTPDANIVRPMIVKGIYCIVSFAPVLIVKITGASSISSSPSFLLSGVESISGVLLSL